MTAENEISNFKTRESASYTEKAVLKAHACLCMCERVGKSIQNVEPEQCLVNEREEKSSNFTAVVECSQHSRPGSVPARRKDAAGTKNCNEKKKSIAKY